jgi:DHHC palmitoyltransferase
LGWNAVCNIEEERQRVQLYGPLSLSATTATCDIQISSSSSSNNKSIKNSHHHHEEEKEEINYFPSAQASYCEKCQIERPPRCHHCNVCHRCILQYDHHCIWVNSCTLRCFGVFAFLTFIFLRQNTACEQIA